MNRCLSSVVLCTWGAAACVPAKPAGTHEIDIQVGHDQRKFILEVPGNVDVSKGLPALVSIHGLSSNPYYYSLLTGTKRFNNDQAFNASDPTAAGSFEYNSAGYKWLVALPFGTAQKSSPLCCSLPDDECRKGLELDQANPCAFNAGSCCGTAPQRNVDDIGFMKAVADYLINEMCADPEALFASGFSNGAIMSNRIGCELSHIFRGIAPFDGPLQFGGEFKTCSPERPVSVVQFCGSSDLVCIGGIKSTMQTWAKVNGCSSAKPVPTYTSATTKCTQYQDCSGGTIVEQCILIGLDHNYAGHNRPDKKLFHSQPATNVGGFQYMMNRFSTILPANAARAIGIPSVDEQSATMAAIDGALV